MISDSHYWLEATALQHINNHEIVVLEQDKNSQFTIRHAKDEKDWLYKQAAYVNEPILADGFGLPIPIDIQKGDTCRCLIVDVTIK